VQKAVCCGGGGGGGAGSAFGSVRVVRIAMKVVGADFDDCRVLAD
jgi:hypothetical protein